MVLFMSKLDNTESRLRYYVSKKGLSINAFERSIGVSNGYVNSIVNSISNRVASKIGDVYSDLNVTWLLTGEGDMLKDTEDTQELTDKNSIKFYYELSATASNIEDINDNELNSPYQRILIPKLEGMVALNVTGDSMLPTLNSGDIVIVDTAKVQTIINGELYLVVTRDGQRMIKRLVDLGNTTDEGTPIFNCISDNPDKRRYADFPLEADRIHTLSRVKGSISFL